MRRRRGVVRRVEVDRRGAAHPFEAARVCHRRESGAHRVDIELTVGSGAEEGFDRGRARDALAAWWAPCSGMGRLPSTPRRDPAVPRLAAYGGARIEDGELRAGPRDHRARLDGGAQEDIGHFGFLGREDGHRIERDQRIGVCALDDPGLLPGDRGERVPR